MSKDLKIQTYFRAKPRSEENNGQYSKVRSYDQVLTNRKQAEEPMTLLKMAACNTYPSSSKYPLFLSYSWKQRIQGRTEIPDR